jgi:hypothetical protein
MKGATMKGAQTEASRVRIQMKSILIVPLSLPEVNTIMWLISKVYFVLFTKRWAVVSNRELKALRTKL